MLKGERYRLVIAEPTEDRLRVVLEQPISRTPICWALNA